MIEVEQLSKKYGDLTAVDAITFVARPGVVTGFLGPNGAGKSTTMRMILGLDRPTAGRVLVNGREYTTSQAPAHEVGALLDAKATDKGRNARNHLRALGATVGVGKRRVEDVLEMVGLADVADKSAGSYSLGMGQRLGIGAALLADPDVVMLDEPVNGLDPDGIRWIRSLLRELAAQGRTVFVSSHLMTEMEMTADHLIVIGRGRVLADMSMKEFITEASSNHVRVTSPDSLHLRALLQSPQVRVRQTPEGNLEVEGMTAAQIGDLIYEHHLRIHELVTVDASLEDAFMEMTKDSLEFHGETHPHVTQNNEGNR